MKRIILLVLLAISNDLFAYTVNCNGRQPIENCISWFTDENRVTGKKRRLKINFNVIKGEIDTTSVCSVHKSKSIDEITCKREAYSMFREFCQGSNQLNQNQKRIFCSGYRRFVPIR